MSEPHRILRRQLRHATRPDGSIDVDSLVKLVARTYNEHEEDARRGERSIRLMAEEVDRSTAQLSGARDELHATIEAIRHGIMTVDSGGQVHVCNRRACEILGLPPDFASRRLTLAEVLEHLDRYPIVAGDTAGTVVLAIPPGRSVEIHVESMAQGRKVVLVEDITAERDRERGLRQAESQYRSLFENSVYGIYRDTLEGNPVRVNPALAALNGYASEPEQIEAVRALSANWYVDPGRQTEFMQVLKRDGRVHDFVSEVRRHRTGEKLWVTENAWYVRDQDGAPLYIEGTIQDASERIAAQTAMTRLATVDALTGAKSRYRFMQRIGEEVSNGSRPFVLYCIDLDMFKDVNDIFGHAAGDTVLKAVAQRLHGLAGPDDVVARLGGDEFAIMTTLDANLADPQFLAKQIVEAMRVAIPHDGNNHYIGASIGIASFPEHGSTSQELLKNADIALYQVKAGGRNGWRVFDHQLRTALELRKRIETELRGAIANKRLDLHYQPIVNAVDGTVTGYEALMRFNHPLLGPIAPSQFIPVAEQAGLMTELGAWALSRACEAAAIVPGTHISVNVSANQFRAPGLLAHIEQELRRCQVDAKRLVIELTESVLVSNETVARTVLAELHRLGVKVAVDDFGTGYSSLGYLQHLPISVIKIDRSFTAGMQKQKANVAVIRAILGIGRDLGIAVIAEGVETEAQRHALMAEGCTLMQGFLFSKAKSLEETVADFAASRLRRVRPDTPLAIAG